MENQKKSFSKEEAFCAVPKLLEFFTELTNSINNFNPKEWQKGVTKEALTKERELLVSVFCSLDVRQLRMLFYMHEIRGLCQQKAFALLRNYYQAEIDALNYLGGLSLVDPFANYRSDFTE